jgi:hypothetical protein
VVTVSPDGDLRASDAEREAAAAEIREHFAAGRLSADELGERLEAVYRARTDAELRALRADLPRLPPSPVFVRAELEERRTRLRRELLQQTGGGVALFVLCLVIWISSGGHGQFWPAWVALVTLVPLLRNGWRLYGPAPELDRVEAELARRREHDARHARRRLRS